MQLIVGIGDMAISSKAADTIKTFALASCVGITAYSPVRKVGGLIHISLPKPPNDNEGIIRCCYYASTGIPYFINRICNDYGCLKGELSIGLFGGANSIRNDDIFNVGRKNLEAVKSILEEMNLKFYDNETGKNVSRTIELEISTGQVYITYQNIKI